jgi:drug/metabolite transporter (DMT)-like permease
MNKYGKSYLFAVSATMLWSTVAVAFKLTLKWTGPISMLVWSSAASLMALTVVCVSDGSVKSIRGLGRKQIGKSALLGALNPFIYYIVLFGAYNLLPAQEAQPLNYLWPLTLVLFSALFLGHRIPLVTVVSLVLGLLGVYVIATRGDFTSFRFSNSTGVALALGSACIWALYWIFNLNDPVAPQLRILLNFAFGTVYIFVYAVSTGLFQWPDAQVLLGCMYIGFFEMGITFLLWLHALRNAGNPSKISGIVYFSPFISLIWISVILKETIVASTLIGLALIIGGILLQHLRTSRTGR